MKEIQTTVDSPQVKLSDVHQIRRMSFYNSLYAVYQSWRALHKYFIKRKGENKKTLFLFEKLTEHRFVSCMYLMMDIIPVLAALSLVFQEKDLDMSAVRAVIDGFYTAVEIASKETRYYQKLLFTTHMKKGEVTTIQRLKIRANDETLREVTTVQGLRSRVDNETLKEVITVQGLKIGVDDDILRDITTVQGFKSRVDNETLKEVITVQGLKIGVDDDIRRDVTTVQGFKIRVDDEILRKVTAVQGLKSRVGNEILKEVITVQGLKIRMDDGTLREVTTVQGLKIRVDDETLREAHTQFAETRNKFLTNLKAQITRFPPESLNVITAFHILGMRPISIFVKEELLPRQKIQ